MSLEPELAKNLSPERKVPKGWQRITLGQFATFHRGYDLPHADMIEGKYPVVGSNGIIGFHEDFKAKGPGVVIGRSGNLGKPFFAKTDYWPHNTSLYVSEFHCSDPSFVYYFLKTLNLGDYNAGSAVPTLNRNHIHSLEVVVPSKIEEQAAIGKILSNLDSKIEVNSQSNKFLEAVGEAVFKHWFVDFEFPNQEGKPYKTSGGETIDTEIGNIPYGWEQKKMSELITVTDGTHSSPKKSDSGYYLITSKHVKEQGIDFSQAYKISASDFTDIIRRSGVATNDILITMIGTVGNILLIQEKTIDFAIKNIGLFKLSERPDLVEYVYYYLMSPKATEYFRTRVSGTTQGYLTLESLRNFPIVIPPEDVLRGFKEIINPFFDKIWVSRQQTRTLLELRNNLLPKLMSGKIRVPVTKEKVERVGYA